MNELDPALIEQILAMQDADEDPQAQKQAGMQQMANKLRMQGMNMGSPGFMAGQQFIPTGISNVGNMLMGHMGASQMQGQADKLGGELTDKRTAGRKSYFGAMSKALRRPAPVGTAGAGAMDPPTPDFGDVPDYTQDGY